ncbi:MAG: signal peptide peptidase SppA [Spirochaetaceae bacterium]
MNPGNHRFRYALLPALLFYLLFLTGSPSGVEAQEFGKTFDSVAAPRTYRTPGVNPAALSFGAGLGIGYAQGFTDENLTGDFDFFVNSKNSAYQLHKSEDALAHRFALSFSPLRNLYLGSSLLTDSLEWQDIDYSLGFLVRPTDYISIGGRSDFTADTQWEPAYRLGLGLRPLAFTPLPAHALTLTGDIPFSLDGFKLPVFTAHSEPVEGLEIGFGYDMENEGLLFEASLSFFNFKSGITAEGSASNGGAAQSVSGGRGYVQFSPLPFNRPRSSGEDLVYHFDLERPLAETKQTVKIGDYYFFSDEPTVFEASRKIKDLAEDPLVSGIAFINEHPVSNYAHLLELREALLEFKSADKEVIFFSETMSTLDYILAASTADAIYLSPTGMIDLKGISISSPYLAAFLERWGIEIENYRSSKYKTGYDFLSEPEMREEEREALTAVVEDLYASMKAHIEEGRGSSLSAPVDEIIRSGPYLLGESALEAGLVDKLIYRDQLEETIPFYQNTHIADSLPLQTIRREWSDPPTGKIAFINAVGAIHTGEGVPGQSIGSKTLSHAIKAARQNSSIDAILLRVDSGGGSVIASEAIAREIKLCREGENAKPLVVSMGATAASGGYYISAYADSIVGYPTTITGSIGVISLLPHIENLLENQKIEWDTVKSGDRGDFGSIYRSPSEEEKEHMRSFIDSTYHTFVSAVAEGRSMETEEVDEVARGRIWTGNQAQERGLIDRTGGFAEALEVIREKSELPDALEFIDYTFADSRGTFSLNSFSSQMIEIFSADPRPYSMHELPDELKPLADYLYYSGKDFINRPPYNRPLYLMPYHTESFTD